MTGVQTCALPISATFRWAGVVSWLLEHPEAKSREGFTDERLEERLITFVEQAEQQLDEGERLPMSTEILESSFSLYQPLERQHSKGGFTSLLTTFGALLKPTMPAAVKKAFAKVSNQNVRQWVAENLGATLTSRRRATYAEYANAPKRATIQPAPT